MKLTASFFRITLLSAILFFAKPTQAQYWAGLGYHMSVPVGIKNLNSVIDKFNNNRDYLSKDMKHIGFLDGFTARVGAWRKSVFYDIGYTGAGQRVYSIGNEPGVGEKQTDLKVTFNAVDFCFGKIVKNEEFNSFGFGIIGSFGTMRVRTRTDNLSSIKNAFWKDPIKEAMYTIGVVGRYMTSDPGLTFEPYVKFSFFGLAKANAADVNKMINEKTYKNDPESMNFNATSVGLRIMISVTTKK